MHNPKRVFIGLACLGVLVGLAPTASASPAVPAPPPNKAHVNLTQPAKLADTTSAAPTTAPAKLGAALKASDGVVSITQSGDGITHVTQYDTAPGISRDQLYRNLSAAGKTGLVNPAAAAYVAAASSAACYPYVYGTARSLCPSAHWANNGFTRPQVYFADHSGANWPVPAAATVWNQAARIDSFWRWATCSSVSGAHCVNVYDANYGATGWAGLTTWSYYTSSLNFVDGTVVIKFNDYYSYNAAGFRQDACHEMGHALGLDHNSSTGSCLYSAILNNGATLPSSQDFAVLNQIYAVSH